MKTYNRNQNRLWQHVIILIRMVRETIDFHQSVFTSGFIQRSVSLAVSKEDTNISNIFVSPFFW